MTIAGLLLRLKHNQTPFEVEEELQFHIESLEQEYARQGLSAVDAKEAALKRFGNLDRIRQQCVHISSRSSLLRRVLKISLIFLALVGLSIHSLSPDEKISHVGDTLVMIAIAGRLLLYVRGLRLASN